MGFFTDLLNSDNHFLRIIAINLLANLASVDNDIKFEELFDRYFGNIKSDRTMVAGKATLNSGKIAKEIPKFRDKITNILLNIDKIHKGKQIELMKGYAIEAFDEYFKEVKDKKEILSFVKEQLNSNSTKTKRITREFIDK
jgi:hypothetical protein